VSAPPPAAAAPAAEVVPAQPRHAATVVLLRDGELGVQAYLLRRVPAMAFAAGMTVFPGGSVDPRDLGADIAIAGPPDPAQWGGLLAADEDLARALVCAAVRETFEESGVLLAGPVSGAPLQVSGPPWEAARVALERGQQSLAGLLGEHDLRLRTDLLRPWAHWITPEAEPKRFDTRFFVALLPPGQAPRDVGGEADRAGWFRPVDALAALQRGELPMLPPTSFTLAEIAAVLDAAGADASAAAVLAAAAERDIAPVLPRIVMTGDQAEVLLPGDERFGQ